MTNLLNEQKLVERIKSIQWDNRLSRPGFLQSKTIVTEAEQIPVSIIEGVTLKYDSQMWVKDFRLYGENSAQSFNAQIEGAFSRDEKWPLHIIERYNLLTDEKDKLVKKLLNVGNVKLTEKYTLQLFEDYRNLLLEIQKYYVFAVPLTSYCDNKLKVLGIDPVPFAVSYKKLDVDLSFLSVKAIQSADTSKKEILIERHLKKYAWIKTGYNLISPYTRKDLDEELEKDVPVLQHSFVLPEHHQDLVVGLQIGIYLRNRMKELSQQLWYAIEELGNIMAGIIGISRDDFFQLLYREAVDSFEKKKCVITKEEIDVRHRGFAVGFVDYKFVLITGSVVDKLNEFFSGSVDKSISEIKGNIACKGVVRGTVKTILSRKDFDKFQTGEILVTSMTTPDFILLMKKAAAIVTNEGGLSSHAAIVSRELGVPCIIGTKIATKVLEDGDLVEVDADKGVVKILKRAEGK